MKKIKNNKKKTVLVLFLIVVGLLTLWGYRYYNFLHLHPKERELGKGAFYAVQPVAHFSSGQTACLNVEIEGKEFIAELDLGFSGDVGVNPEFVEQIVEKSFIKMSSAWGFRGNKHEERIFNIPKLKIGETVFPYPILREENLYLWRESRLIEKNMGPAQYIGAIGWRLFKNMTLFLDLGRSKLVFCDSVETFEMKQHSLQSFIKAPLLLDRDILEFETETPTGTLRCFLDSGSTGNLIHFANPEEFSFRELIYNEQNHVKFPSFTIEGKNIGPITFYPLPLKFPFHVDAVLGMNFLLENQVFIDFKNKQLYIRPYLKSKKKKEMSQKGDP